MTYELNLTRGENKSFIQTTSEQLVKEFIQWNIDSGQPIPQVCTSAGNTVYIYVNDDKSLRLDSGWED